MSTIKTSFFQYIDSLISNGYTKEAYEILGEATTLNSPTQSDTSGKLTPDYSAPPKPVQKEKQPSSFVGKPGGAAPIIELSRIVDDIKKDPTFKGLPNKMQKGILKIEKMTENAFRFASEKEAFIGGGDSLKTLKKTLDKFGPSAKGLPEDVIKSLSNLHRTIDTEMQRRGPEKGLLEKGKEITRDLSEKGKEFLEERKQRKEQKFELEQRNRQNEEKFTEILKKKLIKHPVYSKIFYKLPPQIIKALNDVGLGMDNLKITERGSFSVKAAYMVGNVILRYLNKNNTNSKEAMDFSGIGNMITPESKLNEREISRVIRLAIAAELDAVHLYELIVDTSDDKSVKEVLQDIADEEKVHVGELQELLKKFDKTDEKFLEEGKKEVEDMNVE